MSSKHLEEEASYIAHGLLSSMPVSQAVKPKYSPFVELYKSRGMYSAQKMENFAFNSQQLDPSIDSAAHIENGTADDAVLLCRPCAVLGAPRSNVCYTGRCVRARELHRQGVGLQDESLFWAALTIKLTSLWADDGRWLASLTPL